MRRLKFFLFTMFMVFVNNVMANPISGEAGTSANAGVTQAEELVIVLTNFYETPGHKEAVAQVLLNGGGLPAGNYTYEWTAIPGGTGTTCNLWPATGRRNDVSVNYVNPNSSRVELECEVYLNGSLYTTLSYFWYMY